MPLTSAGAPPHRRHLALGEQGCKLFLYAVCGPLGVSGVVGGGYVASSLEVHPTTGRLQLIMLSKQLEKALGQEGKMEVMNKEESRILPEDHHIHKYVKHIGESIKRTLEKRELEMLDGWDVHVIKSPVANAFVLPNGSIFVYTGLLEIADTKEQMAAVMGHEVAHALGRHSAEQMSFASMAVNLTYVLSPYDISHGYGYGYGYRKPSPDDMLYFFMASAASLFSYLAVSYVAGLAYSRALETEADMVGQRLMARAGYDPRCAKEVWLKFEALEKAKGKGGSAGKGEWASTHPSNSTRVENLRKWEGECMDDFKKGADRRFEEDYLGQAEREGWFVGQNPDDMAGWSDQEAEDAGGPRALVGSDRNAF